MVCLEGTCSLHFGGQDYVLGRGMCLVAVSTHVHHVVPSADCRLLSLRLAPEEHSTLMPDTSWGVCGEFHFFTHPVFKVDDETLMRLAHDMDEIELRMTSTPEHYRDVARRKALELFYLDLVHAHEQLFAQQEVSKNYALIMNRFVSLLKEGAYRSHRTVEYYANELCITSKHLHKVSTQVSGHTPSYWIQRFTVMEARYLLKREGRSQKEVARILGFDNVAHFNRYISNNAGVTPGRM